MKTFVVIMVVINTLELMTIADILRCIVKVLERIADGKEIQQQPTSSFAKATEDKKEQTDERRNDE